MGNRQSALVFAFVLFISGIGFSVRADVATKGPDGINSLGLGLTGAGVAIGQIERGRPGMQPPDSWNFISSAIHPAQVFQVMLPPVQDTFVDVHNAHATRMAGVMISDPQVLASVAPDAILYSSTLYDATYHPTNNPSYPEGNWAIAAEGIALLNGGDVPIINISAFDVSHWPNPPFPLDGESFPTRVVDFAARYHDVLFVAAKGNETPTQNQFGPPSDMYNGLIIGGSQANNGIFNQVWANTSFTHATNDRRLIHLIAPASDQVRMGLDVVQGQPNPLPASPGGTSSATPHASGVAALLHEHANNQQWGADARRHEVIKAVLMNSADKLEDPGDGTRLCMEKTINDTGGQNWLASDAYTDSSIPLHIEMGVGHLNAKRALKQFEAGQHNSVGTADVPLIGWDYSTTNATINKYVLDKPLAEDSFISITLAWDRFVDVPNYVTYDVTNMQLYLLPKDANDFQDAVASSVSTIYSVEHIFFQIPEEGEYEIWVGQADSPVGPQQYALAWWAVESRGHCPADLNGDGVVDGADLNLLLAAWGGDRCGHPADLTGDGTVGGNDMFELLSNWGACPGACCLSDGSCQQKQQNDCEVSGGEYLGHTVSCLNIDCLGACCLDDGSCVDGLSMDQCEQQDGIWNGGGTECKSRSLRVVECEIDPPLDSRMNGRGTESRRKPTRCRMETSMM